MARAERKWELLELPADLKIDEVAMRRCSPFLDAAMHMHNIGQDFIKVLMISCYLQGAADAESALRTSRMKAPDAR